MFKIGGDLSVNRLGFGAMRVTGDGIWGWPKDRDEARKVLRRVVEQGVNLIDTADVNGSGFFASKAISMKAILPRCCDGMTWTRNGNN